DGTGYSVIASLVSPRGPASGLIEATNGALYGTTQLGGTSGDGTVFRLQRDGSSFAVLKSFSASGEDANSPYSAPILAGTNELFGTSRLGGHVGAGAVYSLRFDGAGYQLVSSLDTPAGP